MEPVILSHISKEGATFQAAFLPEHGMNLMSYKRDDIEVIDQKTLLAFQERSAGLGALIGPHFHRRRTELLPKIENENRFPQSAYCKAHGIEDLFSHGVARYVPWKYEKTAQGLKAVLSGKDLWKEIPLALIEGQNFQMTMDVALGENGLKIHLSVVSDTDSLVGLHYYYRLPEGKKTIRASSKESCYLEGNLTPIPKEWGYHDHSLAFQVDRPIDSTFFPYPDPLAQKITYETEEFVLNIDYSSPSEENSWQIYHPDDASYVCIEPISAQDPRHPNLSVSSLDILLRINLPVR